MLRSAVSLHPNATEAWTAFADVQEKLGDWDGAYSAWNSLRKLARDSKARDFAEASLRRVNDERVIAKLNQAEAAAAAGDYATALNLLLDSASLKPSDRTFDRARSRYFQLLGAWFGQEVRAGMKANGWKSVAVANFGGGSEIESYSIRDRICSALATDGKSKPEVVFLSDPGIATLQKGQFDSLPEQDRREMARSGADAIVFGTIGAQMQGYIYDARRRQTQPVLTVQPISAIPGFPSNADGWARLPSKSSTSRGLRVEVWTEKARYGIGSEVTFYLRSNRDCYVMLLDLQSSGGLYVLFPNSYQQENFVRGGRIYTIPNPQAPFSINASGPSGVEGVKAIAATKPLSLANLAAARTFVVARTAALQEELCGGILSTVKALSEDEWDVAEWTFEIAR